MITICAWLLAACVQEEDLFPLREGNTWVYATNGRADVTFDVVGTEKVGKRDCAILRIRGGERESRLWLARDKDGIKVIRKSEGEGQAETLFIPALFLKQPCKAGDKWKAGPEEYVVTGPERIEESGKPYSCIKVTITDKSEGGSTQEYWYAPGVGPVKWTWAGGGQKLVCDLKETRRREPERAPAACAKCGGALQETDKFCGGCGTKREAGEKLAEAACAKCGAKFQGAERFCAECGGKREDAPLAIVPEGTTVDDLVVSPEGKTAAYRGHAGNSYCVVVGDRIAGVYPFIHAPLTLGEDGTVAYAVCRDGTCRMVVGAKEGDPFPRIRDFAFHPRTRRVAYVVEEGNDRFMVVDGKRESHVGASSPKFSPDGSRIAYAAAGFVVLDGRKGTPFASVRDPIFSPDGKTVAYGARDENGAFVVVGETAGEKFDEVWAPAFSPNGNALAFCAEKGKKCFVVVGDRKGEEFRRVWRPVFSPDGSHVAYPAMREGTDLEFVVVDGRKGPDFQSVWGIAFHPNGTLAAYAAGREGKQVVVVGDKAGESYDRVSPPVFSADGNKVSHGALQGREIRWITRDVE